MECLTNIVPNYHGWKNLVPFHYFIEKNAKYILENAGMIRQLEELGKGEQRVYGILQEMMIRYGNEKFY